MSKDTICVWADGTFCESSELEQYSHMSDDYATIYRCDELMDEDLVDMYMRGLLDKEQYITD